MRSSSRSKPDRPAIVKWLGKHLRRMADRIDPQGKRGRPRRKIEPGIAGPTAPLFDGATEVERTA